MGSIRFVLASALVLSSLSINTVLAADEPVKVGALLQSWLYNDTTTTAARPDFRIRRAELKASGRTSETTRWFLMIDAAKSLSTGPVVSTNDNKILQDIGVAFMVIPDLELTVGQFKTPTTAEGLESSAELLLPERSAAARTYGDVREPGAMLTYTHDMWKVRTMVSNGQSTNVSDNNAPKNIAMRIDAQPTERFQFGGFTSAQDFRYNARGRIGLNAGYTNDKWLLRAEGVAGKDYSVRSNGWVADVAYMLCPNFQAVGRVEGLNPNTSKDDSGNAETLGLNYYIAGNKAKIQASYSWLQDFVWSSNALNYRTGKGTLFILAFQAAM